MPKGTRVHRCVIKLKRQYPYSKAIAICQKSTKQNYMTGKTLRQRKRRTRQRKRRTRQRKRRTRQRKKRTRRRS